MNPILLAEPKGINVFFSLLPRDGICRVYPTVCVQDILWDVFGVNTVDGVSDVPGKIIGDCFIGNLTETTLIENVLTVEW